MIGLLSLDAIIALTALVTIVVRPRFKGNARIAVASILGIFAGVGGASHGPGEKLQGNIAPGGIIIQAWPELTSLAGEPAVMLNPSFNVSGILTVITGAAVTIWVAISIHSKDGPLVLMLLLKMMLLVGGGLIPPVLGVVAAIIGTRIRQKDFKKPQVRKHKAWKVEPLYMQGPNPLGLIFC